LLSGHRSPPSRTRRTPHQIGDCQAQQDEHDQRIDAHLGEEPTDGVWFQVVFEQVMAVLAR
jgi:hypothetical protein